MMALDGGRDGLIFYRKISEIGTSSLKAGGKMYFEVGHDQSGQVSAILEDLGYSDIEIKTDLQGFERVVIARL
jgi:release factor glutamine methyltransferase